MTEHSEHPKRDPLGIAKAFCHIRRRSNAIHENPRANTDYFQNWLAIETAKESWKSVDIWNKLPLKMSRMILWNSVFVKPYFMTLTPNVNLTFSTKRFCATLTPQIADLGTL